MDTGTALLNGLAFGQLCNAGLLIQMMFRKTENERGAPNKRAPLFSARIGGYAAA
jgi:hypothetical protein